MASKKHKQHSFGYETGVSTRDPESIQLYFESNRAGKCGFVKRIRFLGAFKNLLGYLFKVSDQERVSTTIIIFRHSRHVKNQSADTVLNAVIHCLHNHGLQVNAQVLS